jgi:hypothetical protein
MNGSRMLLSGYSPLALVGELTEDESVIGDFSEDVDPAIKVHGKFPIICL